MEIIGIQDLILTPILVLLIWFWAKNHSARQYGNTTTASYFMRGLMFRVLGSIMLSVIYIYVFGYGDSLVYFKRTIYVTKLLLNNPLHNWIIFFPDTYFNEIINIPGFPTSAIQKSNSYMVVQLCTFSNLFLFDSYFANGVIFSLWGFVGSWKLFQVFYDYKPSIAPKAALFCMYLPSILLWGSGILKDTISFGGLCVLVYCVYQIFIKAKYKPKYFLAGFACIYLVGVTKSYILLVLAPSLVFYILNQYGSGIKSTALKAILFPIILATVAGLSFLILNALSSTFTTYNLDNIEEKAEGFQRWHTIRAEQTNGAVYTLPEGNIFLKALAALNVTFYRPYLWETKKPIVFLAAIESFYVLLFTLNTIRKAGIGTLFRSLIGDPLISFCFVFAMIFGFAVGSTSYNFGALSRFKIPCIPFYMAALCLSEIKRQEEAAKNTSYIVS